MNLRKSPVCIACFGPKGGCGKTTTATQLSTSATKHGSKVCFYDMDKQKTATFYFSLVDPKFRPAIILHDFNQPPPEDCDFIIVDCEPNLDFIPPKEFTIVAPTLAGLFDLHSYRKVFELEKEGYKVIKVVNQYSMVRNDDKAVKEQLDPCVVISANTGIRHAMNNGKTIWNSNHPGGKRAKNQFTYLIKRIQDGKVEALSHDDITKILLTGEK